MSFILNGMTKKSHITFALFIALAGAAAIYVLLFTDKDTRQNNQNPQSPQHSGEQEAAPAGFNKSLYSISEPGSPWWVVNKKRPLPEGYVPPDLVVPDVKLRLASGAEQMQFSKSAVPALEEMFKAAANDGVMLVFGSGFRSENYQRTLYNQYVAADGQTAADRYSARPGTSEHQTGLSFDATASNGACHLEKCFKDTPEGAWLAKNAHKYGFIVRYAEGKESVTGYDYEPWHMRYVGKELAEEMHKTNIQTLEEFFNLPPAPTY